MSTEPSTGARRVVATPQLGIANVRWLIAAAILIVLVILASQVYSGTKTPLRTITVGSNIVVTCKAAESIWFTGFAIDESAQEAIPFVRGYLGPTAGTSQLKDEPPAGVPLRLRFAINTDTTMQDFHGMSVPANKWHGVVGPLPADAKEIPFDDDVLEYIHSGGKVELHVKVVDGRLLIEFAKPE